MDAQSLPLEYAEVSEEVVTIKLEGYSKEIILTFSEETNGERYYAGMDSVRLNSARPTRRVDFHVKPKVDPEVEQLFKSNPIFGMHAVLIDSTLYIGTPYQQVERVEGRYIGHRSIDLVRSADGKLVSVQK